MTSSRSTSEYQPYRH
uniref:(California timema) hypothetical protein n=1 Tax=Timema californicum TaxID=61474 RepID=A0A7R9JKE9_TIMCA|nr:unnamed protein product [Timema californicum]